MKYLFITLKVQDGEHQHTHRVLHITTASSIQFAAQRYASTYWGYGEHNDDGWWEFESGCLALRVENVKEISEYEHKLLWDIFTGFQRTDKFQIVQAGWCEASQREEVQILASEDVSIYLFETDEGFVVDVYNKDENIDSMTIWEDDLTPDETDSPWSEIHNDFEDEGFIHIDAWTTSDDNEGGSVIAKINTSTKEVIYLDERAKTNSLAQESIQEVLDSLKNE